MWVCVLGRCCLCCVAAPCSGPSPAPPLEKDIPGCKRLCSKLSEYTESQAQAEKNPKIPKFPFPKYMTFPYFTFQDHVPLSLVFKLCGLSADRQLSDLCNGNLSERELWSLRSTLWKLFWANLFKEQEGHTICLLDQRKSTWDLIKMILPSSQAV